MEEFLEAKESCLSDAARSKWAELKKELTTGTVSCNLGHCFHVRWKTRLGRIIGNEHVTFDQLLARGVGKPDKDQIKRFSCGCCRQKRLSKEAQKKYGKKARLLSTEENIMLQSLAKLSVDAGIPEHTREDAKAVLHLFIYGNFSR
jgi:hypothetical protein